MGIKLILTLKWGDLSIADKQLIAICRALLFNAKLIIIDEPNTSLTKKEVNALFDTVRKLLDSGIAIMFISHKLEEIYEIADEVTILRNGKNVFYGTPEEISLEDFMYYMTGRRITGERFVPKNTDKPVLEIRNSLKGAYNDVSLELHMRNTGHNRLLGSGH